MGGHSNGATRRLFIAVMLPEQVREKLAGLTHLLQGHESILRPVAATNLHCTLRFLGDTSSEREDRTRLACAYAVEGVEAFTISFQSLGVFPNARRPTIVWVDIHEGHREMTELARRLDEALRAEGVVDQHETFVPHVTLARVRHEAKPFERVELGTLISHTGVQEHARCPVSAVSLVESTLTPKGSVYAVREEFFLA
jgi:2'-5' RNA ligase